MFSNKISFNFSGGEVAPGLLARTDIPLYNKVLSRMENFIAEPHGTARYRPGFKYVHHTRNNKFAVFIEFQFSDVQSYLIEATEGYFRFYKDGAIILSSAAQVITAATKANPCVITYTGPDPLEGQEMFIQGIGGMTQLNGKYVTLKNVNTGAKTAELTDVFGANINSTSYSTLTSSGTGNVVYEIKTPYLESDLRFIQYTQNADTMRFAHTNYAPRKLTRSAHDNWTLTRYTRTVSPDPFEIENTTFGSITGVNTATDTISDPGHTFNAGDHVYITEVVGTVEINNRHCLIDSPSAGAYKLKDYSTGLLIDLVNAWVSGGVVEKIGATSYPAAVGFTDDARLAYAGTKANPESQWYSKSPAPSGAIRFDDLTGGTADSDAINFTLAPLRGKVDSIRWITNTDKYIALGTFGSIRRMYGDTEQASLTPTAVTAKAANSDGVYPARPVVDGSVLFYIARSSLTLETLEYNYQIDGYAPDDKNLVSSHITTGGLRQIARQIGRPTIIWAVRADGTLLGLTYKAKENIAGWHRHTLGGDGVVESVGVMPRDNNQEQIWVIVKRTINGHTVRYVEYMSDVPIWPDVIDFYTLDSNEEADVLRFFNYQSEQVKYANHLDSSLTYDGSDYGKNANASITLGSGCDVEDTENVTVTASASVFTASMVGRQIWGVYDSNGYGGGRLEITGYTSPTVVTGTIVDPFLDYTVFASGSWFLTATTISGLDHLEGKTVALITDGAVPDTETVVSGSITTAQPASVIHVGLPYRGILRMLPLDQGGINGPAHNKLKIVAKVAVRFENSAGVRFGTSLYRLMDIDFRRGSDYTDRPVPLFTGPEELSYEDTYGNDKTPYIVQDSPLPCIIQAVDLYVETSEE